MASDRARISYDPSRQYRGVLAQQGRVTLEADVNEGGRIAAEALRWETIDIVGPAGTPSIPAPGAGYKVTPGPTLGQTSIGAGIYYLGGWRLTLDQPVTLDVQPDWADRSELSRSQGNAVISLLVTEQSVCAVEDQALREVALGGPDSAARLRLMQRFLMTPLEGDSCPDGAVAVAKQLAADGVALDPYSYQLISSARLQVGFVADGTPPDPCTPVAAGGYLGADNQLVRVTVATFDAAAKTGSLLWAWNNASILYRADLTDKAAGVFTLQGEPIDQEHAPQTGQAVEILRIRSRFEAPNLIAAGSGFVTTIKQPYTFDGGTLTIAEALPSEYLDDPGPFFIRLWQAIVPFESGKVTPLDSVSGLTVTIDLAALPSLIAARPFWRFAVRPDTPTQIVPTRYQSAPQPPDGPRQWLCELGVIGGSADGLALLADCRPTFLPLTDQTSCCGLTLDPAGIEARGGLQAVVDTLAGGPAVLSLQPGAYFLQAPLVLTGHHKRLVIEGCTFGASLRADPAKLKAFAFGLIVIEKTDAVTLRHLEFDVSMVPEGKGGTVAGVLILDAGLIVIEDCTFGIEAARNNRIDGTVFGGAIVVIGRAAELTVRRNRFTGRALFHDGVVCGVMAAVNTRTLQASLSGVDISDNDFERLNAGVFAYAHLGEIRCSDNRVRGCVTGFLFAESRLGATSAFAKHAVTNAPDNEPLATGVQSGFQSHLLATSAQSKAAFFTRMAEPAAPDVPKPARDALLKELASRGKAIFQELKSKLRAATTPAATEAIRAQQAASTDKVTATGAPAATIDQNAANTRREARAGYLDTLNHVDAVSVAAEATTRTLTAAVRLHGNDVVLARAPGQTLGLGIGVWLSPADEAGMVQLSDNRVICADHRTNGASLLFPRFATVTGNLLVRPGGDAVEGHAASAVFVMIGEQGGAVACTGNVFRSGAFIVPPRTAPAPSPDWSFFNTEG